VIFWILEWLKYEGAVKVPAVFLYTSTRMILAALTSLLLSIFLGPRFIHGLYVLKMGQPIRMEDCPLLGQLHEKNKDTPTMGGILILSSMLVALLLWMDLTQPFTWILLATTLVLGCVGGWDDYLKLKYKNPKGMSARTKLIFQFGLGACVAAYLLIPAFSVAAPQIKFAGATLTLQEYASLLFVPFFKEPFHLTWPLVPALLTMFVVSGSSNAVNLTDGLDGLAAGCLILVAATLSLVGFVMNHHDLASYLNIPYVEGSGEIAIYLCAFMGACLGFLWYNGHPAQVFMGDIGSLTLGGILGVAAVLLNRQILLGLVGGIFVAEALSVILQVGSYKLRNKKRIFLCAPLHHHFEYKGWPETKVVIRFWIVGLLLALIGIGSLKFQ